MKGSAVCWPRYRLVTNGCINLLLTKVGDVAADRPLTAALVKSTVH